jgi:hypothetical protein
VANAACFDFHPNLACPWLGKIPLDELKAAMRCTNLRCFHMSW